MCTRPRAWPQFDGRSQMWLMQTLAKHVARYNITWHVWILVNTNISCNTVSQNNDQYWAYIIVCTCQIDINMRRLSNTSCFSRFQPQIYVNSTYIGRNYTSKIKCALTFSSLPCKHTLLHMSYVEILAHVYWYDSFRDIIRQCGGRISTKTYPDQEMQS